MPDVPFRLEDLSGHWEGRGRDASTYDLWVDFPQQTSMTVHTTRPRGGRGGAICTRCTRGLITLDNQNRVWWNRDFRLVVEAFRNGQASLISWQRPGGVNRPSLFRWEREALETYFARWGLYQQHVPEPPAADHAMPTIPEHVPEPPEHVPEHVPELFPEHGQEHGPEQPQRVSLVLELGARQTPGARWWSTSLQEFVEYY